MNVGNQQSRTLADLRNFLVLYIVIIVYREGSFCHLASASTI